MRRAAQGMSPVKAGLVAIVLVAIGTYFGFSKSIPFRSHYEVKAVFADANLVQKRSPVRIAGVEVGRVERVERYRDTDHALVTMRITDAGRPIHRDATLKVRPRLFLEGNFFVELQPGTPKAGELGDGELIPATQTASPVQLDNVLSALDDDVRGSLQDAVRGFGDALDSEPTAAEDATQDPAVRGLTGGEALNRTLDSSPGALRGTAIVAEALRGPRPGDLSRLIHGFARAAAGLAADEQALRDLVTGFDATMRTTAAHAGDLEQTIRELGPAARGARRAFAALDRALPPTRRFARQLAPAMAELPATMQAARPWLRQARELMSDPELGGLLQELSPAVSDLAALARSTKEFLPRIDRFNRCITDVIIPTGNIRVDDDAQSSGVENYKEFWYAMVASAAEAQGFDGNGPYLRLQAAGGPNRLQSGLTNYGRADQGSLFANTAIRPLSTRPAFPNKVPPLRRDVPCHTQPVPDVNGPASIGPADGSAPGAAAPPAPAREEAGR
jgi:ABC-type transporter Mla subunit MlaD